MIRRSFTPAACGYIADFVGEVVFKPLKGVQHLLQPNDKKRALRLHVGDVVTAVRSGSTAYLVVYGKRAKLSCSGKQPIHYVVRPDNDQNSDQQVSRTMMAGRGAGSLAQAMPFEKLAIFTQQGKDQDIVGSLIPNLDGTLPVVWIAQKDDVLKLTLAIQTPKVLLERTIVVPRRQPCVRGFPFYSIRSKELGEHILMNLAPDQASFASLTISNGRTIHNTTRWQIEKRSSTYNAMHQLQSFDLSKFDGLDSALSFCENGFEGQRATLVLDWWQKEPTYFARLNALHYLCLEYGFNTLQVKLKAILDKSEIAG